MQARRDALRCVLVVVALAAAVGFALLAQGCGPAGPRLIEGTSLRDAYRGMGYECGTILLRLSDDGSFVLACVPPGDGVCDTLNVSALAARDDALSGVWESRGGDLTLAGSEGPDAPEITIVFTECEVAVEAHGRSELLAGLRWVMSTRPSFVDSSRLMGSDDLEEFLHPSAGSGSSTSAL